MSGSCHNQNQNHQSDNYEHVQCTSQKSAMQRLRSKIFSAYNRKLNDIGRYIWRNKK